MGAFIFDDEGEMGGVMCDCVPGRIERAEENGEGVCAHRFNEDGAIGDLVESGCVHGRMISKCNFIVASLRGFGFEMWGGHFLNELEEW